MAEQEQPQKPRPADGGQVTEAPKTSHDLIWYKFDIEILECQQIYY